MPCTQGRRRIAIISTTWQTVSLMTPQDQGYRAFIIELHRRMEAAGSKASLTGGIGMVPLRAAELERALIGQAPDEKLLCAACESCRKLDAIDDVHSPAAYRQHLATVLARRALEQARARLPSRAGVAAGQTS